jgi:ribosomal protein L36
MKQVSEPHLPSGLFGDVRKTIFGFCFSTASMMPGTSRLKSGFLDTASENTRLIRDVPSLVGNNGCNYVKRRGVGQIICQAQRKM